VTQAAYLDGGLEGGPKTGLSCSVLIVEGICELGPLVAMGTLLLFFCLRWRLGWVPVERAWESGGGEREWRDSQPLLLMLLLLRI
jgi:hypothetical protein